jgi:hypothetical protein
MGGYAITQTTRDMFDGIRPPRVNMTNAKPFRTRAQKAEARETARLCNDGTWRSGAPVSYHKPV